MERSGGKWREDNGITVRIGGYKNGGIGWGNIRRGHPKMPCDY